MNKTEISVNINELILTPLTCASIVNEIIKCLVYQKSQIPYPYNWLKSVVGRKRQNLNPDEVKSGNVVIERHYRVVSAAYDALQDLISNLNKEFKTFGDNIKQVLILFGATLYCPKEVFRIQLSNFAKGHSEENHLYANCKKQHIILSDIVLAEEWLSAMETLIPPTNMFVLIQKKSDINNVDNFFQLNEQYSEPTRIKNITINLNYVHNIANNCCRELKVFNDKDDLLNEEAIPKNTNHGSSHINEASSLLWYQAKVVLQGFKECYVNKVSATELW